MKKSLVLALSVVALVFVFMFSRRAGEHSCPPGYYYREGTCPRGPDGSLTVYL